MKERYIEIEKEIEKQKEKEKEKEIEGQRGQRGRLPTKKSIINQEEEGTVSFEVSNKIVYQRIS